MSAWLPMIIVALVIVGSVMWVRPSPREQKLAKWRRDAMVAGLKVRLQTLKAEPKNSGIRDDVEGVTYELLNHEADKHDTVSWAIVKTDGWLTAGLPQGWSWYGEEAKIDLAKVQHVMNALPEQVNALQRTPASSRIIWCELGKEFDAENLKSCLQQLQAIK